MKARLTPDRRFVVITGPHHSDRWPVAALPAWLKFYRKLRDRNLRSGAQVGPYHRFYAPTVAELERVAAELRAA